MTDAIGGCALVPVVSTYDTGRPRPAEREGFALMFKPRILFVVGAGASKEAGLPIGNELTATIAEKIKFKFEDFSQTAGDTRIAEALREHVRREDRRGGDIEPYLQACRQISAAMPQAPSIDSFIHTHQGNKEIELCGKLAIVQSILEEEQKSLLFFDPQARNARPDFNKLQKTWYNSFMPLLTEGYNKDNISNIFGSVAFIAFNYDRCIEHFLFHSLQNYYHVEPVEAAGIMQVLRIIHPYGVAGHLPWQLNNGGGVPFGNSQRGKELLALAGQIKTFTESFKDYALITDIHRLVRDAETVVFLGFAFHPQNMDLIQPPKPSNAKHVFATAKGISGNDCTVIKTQLLEFFNSKPQKVQVDIQKDLEPDSEVHEFVEGLARRRNMMRIMASLMKARVVAARAS